MQVSKGYKHSPPGTYDSDSFHVSLSSAEFGLPDPMDFPPEQRRGIVLENYKELVRITESMVILEKVKKGLIPDQQTATELLRPWLPIQNQTTAPPSPNQTSSSTEPASSSGPSPSADNSAPS